MSQSRPEIGLAICHYGHLPAAMTRDVIRQIRIDSREHSLLVIGRDDEVLNEKVRQSRKPKEKNKRK
jgi:hypothetical protein